MLTIRPILHKRKKADGTNKVMICLYHPGLPRRYVSTGLSVAAAHWNPKGEIGKLNWVRSSRTSQREDNLNLADALRTLRELSLTHPLPDDLIHAYNTRFIPESPDLPKPLLEEISFQDYWRNYIEDTAHRWSVHWRPKQESSLRSFQAFHPEPIPLSTLSPAILTDYEKWHIRKGNTQTTVAKELSQIRAVFNAATKARLADPADNPFSSYDIKKGVGHRQTLSWSIINKIENANLPTFEEQRSRDVFLFQFYAGGRRINEVLTLQWEDIGSTHFTYSELKHGRPVRKRRELIPELKTILARYVLRKDQGHRFVFPVYDNDDTIDTRTVLTTGTAIVNNGLYRIADRLGIKRFSSHVARHTWADLARKAGVDLYSISKNLGHARLAQTETYMASFDQEAVEEGVKLLLASRPRGDS